MSSPTPGEDFAADFPDLDPGISDAVRILRARGVETFESCEGGAGHAYAEPTIRFHGHRDQGWRALWAAQESGLPVDEVRRTWPVIDGEPVGPYWELVLSRKLESTVPAPKQQVREDFLKKKG